MFSWHAGLESCFIICLYVSDQYGSKTNKHKKDFQPFYWASVNWISCVLFKVWEDSCDLVNTQVNQKPQLLLFLHTVFHPCTCDVRHLGGFFRKYFFKQTAYLDCCQQNSENSNFETLFIACLCPLVQTACSWIKAEQGIWTRNLLVLHGTLPKVSGNCSFKSQTVRHTNKKFVMLLRNSDSM